MNAEVKYVLRSNFIETLELENFPFDGPGPRGEEAGRESMSCIYVPAFDMGMEAG